MSPLKQYSHGITLMIVAVMLALMTVNWLQGLKAQQQVRHTLDALLDRSDTATQVPDALVSPPILHQPEERAAELFAQMEADMDRLIASAESKDSPASRPGLTIEETESAYLLRVPVNRAEDEKNIKLEVKPHRIRISGEIIQTSPDGKQMLGRSVFLKSFTPSQEVLPDAVSRVITDNMLCITVPKKQPGSMLAPQSGTPASPNTLPTEVQQKLQQQQKSFI